jgi:two-component system nitrate/nitrite response regulator NarL
MPTKENSLTILTDREREIADLVSRGLSNKAIGRLLNITDGTAKVHLHNIFRKLEISNRTVLAICAERSFGVPENKPALPALSN